MRTQATTTTTTTTCRGGREVHLVLRKVIVAQLPGRLVELAPVGQRHLALAAEAPKVHRKVAVDQLDHLLELRLPVRLERVALRRLAVALRLRRRHLCSQRANLLLALAVVFERRLVGHLPEKERGAL